jgi:putative hydrolase of the HAD superfamily
MRDDPERFGEVDELLFLQTYDRHNEILWKKMARGEVNAGDLRILRLRNTFDELDIAHADFVELADTYLDYYSRQTFTMPGAKEILRYLQPQYRLGVLSNGFSAVQYAKLDRMELTDTFEFTIFSQEVGALKPSTKIFKAAESAAATPADRLAYIGDSYENDIVGAKDAGWLAVHFNPTSEDGYSNRLADFEIVELLELRSIF